MGELLSKMVRLTAMDVEEILEQQSVSNRKFGEIALEWGLCAPQHVWTAWYHQLAENQPLIDLNDFGIDTQAIQQVPQELAARLNIIPLRGCEDQLVVAIPPEAPESIMDELSRILGKNIRVVRANAEQIRHAINTHYGKGRRAFLSESD
jgi:hypothetical protein